MFQLNKMKHLDELTKKKADLVCTEIEEYLNTDCVLRKSDLLILIKNTTALSFQELEFVLLESWRTLKRIYIIQKLPNEIKEMYKNNQISKLVLYHLSRKYTNCI